MKILYDHQVFSWQKFGGVSRYFFELIRHSKGLFDYELSGIFSENEYIKNINIYQEFPFKQAFPGKIKLIKFLNTVDSIKKIKQGNYDILHPTYFNPYLLSIKQKPFIITVHDMIHELFPHYYNNNVIEYKKQMIHRADRIIAISESTKTDILFFYPKVDEKKIAVVYHGTPFAAIPKYQIKENYILYTGQREKYKNFNTFINAIHQLLLQYDLRLICTGPSLKKEEIQLLQSLKINDRVESRFVTDDKLLDLYSKAIAFVFPSLYEGFGFPVLEAFAAGCPVVLSNASCFPEIAKDAAMYFDPYSKEDIKNVVKKIILDTTLRDDMIDRGFIRLSEFSWEKTALQTYREYCKL
jgi:glycosyltransferase involved in cell wall biosynthesis